MRKLTVLVIAALALAPLGVAGASMARRTHRPSAKTLAADVCEDMVHNALEASLGAPLPAPQQGSWAGNVYTCIYPLPGGQLVLRVNDTTSKATAQASFARLVRASRGATRLNGLGDRAYQEPDGTLVVWKDQFIVTVDPSAVPPPTSRSDLAFAAIVALMGCW